MDPLVHAVLSAAEQGHKQRLATLLRENPGMAESCDEEGSTPLMYAAANGRENVLYLLVQNQVNINAQNLYGWTALMQAACYGHLTCVMLLVQHKADVRLCNSWGASALVGAAQGGFDVVVQFLLDQGAAVNVEEEVTSLTPLMAAAQCGHVDIAGKLIKAGSSVNAVLKATGWSALMLAAVNNQKEVVSLLLQQGANKEHKDISKRTAVQLATVLGHREAALVLDGERIDTVSDTDFFESVKAGQADKVEAMLKVCAALAKAKTKDGFTPLMRAANKGHVKVCEILLRAGCPVNAKDSVNGWTALMQATHQRRYEVAKLLGCRGADVNLRGKSGSTAFDIANMLGDIQMIRIVANISVERIRKTSAPPPVTSTKIPPLDSPSSNTPPTTNSATPTSSLSTPEPPTTTSAPTTERVALKKYSVSSCPTRLKSVPPPKPLDTSELIRKLRMAYADPISSSVPTPKATVSAVQDSGLPRFPSSRLRNQKARPGSIPSLPNSQKARPGSIPSSPNSSTDTYGSVSPGASTSTSSSVHLDGSTSSQAREHPLTPEPPKGATSSNLEGGRGGATKCLSRSNPPSTESTASKRGGRGGISIPSLRVTASSPFTRHCQLSVDTGGSKFGARPTLTTRGGAGGREELPSFLHHKSHIPPTIAVPGRPKEIVPKSWRLIGQKSLEAEKQSIPLRKRSFTEPSKPKPKAKPALQTALEQAYLGEYYDLFAEQELDLSSFLTLSESDLIDLCISNTNNRQRLLDLIQRLQNRNETGSSVEQNGASSNGPTPAPLFLFQ